MLWLPDLLPLALFAWLGGIALLIAAVVSILLGKETGRLPLLCCAILSLGVNIAALWFLWEAAVSPGGV